MAGQQPQKAKGRFGLGGGQSYVCCLPRRGLLSGFAAVAASAVLPAMPAVAQSTAQAPAKPAVNAGRIDVHRHFVPPGHLIDPKRNYLNERSTIPKQLEDMDKSGVSLSVMSLSASALSHPDARDARKFSRTVNEYAAKLAGDHPGRFGQFAYCRSRISRVR